MANRNKVFSFAKISILKFIHYLTLPFYNLAIGISPGVVDELKKYGARKTVTIPIPFDITLFPQRIKKERSDKEILTVLFIGQIKETKGIQDLIMAIEILRKELKFSFKTLVGGIPANPKDKEFHKELQEMGKGLDIEFLGWISRQEISQVYQKADIFVLPSYSEALGMVIVEAMASGLPVIATKTSGAEYLIKDKKTGFLVPVGDVNAIKEKIKI